MHAVARTGIAGQPAFGETVFLGTASSATGWVATALRLSLTLARGLDVSTARGDARFRWLVAVAEACPIRLGGPSLAARLCADIEGGALLAEGVNAPEAQSVARPWVAPGLALRGEWLATDALSFELQIGAMMPLLRDSFGFGPPGVPPVLVLPEVPPVFASTSLGIALRTP